MFHDRIANDRDNTAFSISFGTIHDDDPDQNQLSTQDHSAPFRNFVVDLIEAAAPNFLQEMLHRDRRLKSHRTPRRR